MRQWILLLLFAAAALPAPAAQRVTVAELRQYLTEQFAAHKSDGSIAERLDEMELSEELTGPALDRITAELKPGKKTLQALQLLADASGFLEPPADEIPAKATPTLAEQLRLFQGAFNFATVTFARLPDFLATRTTHTFDNSVLYVGTFGALAGVEAGEKLHANGEYSRLITYRDGAEVNVEAPAGHGNEEKHAQAPQGMTSTGEFGGILLNLFRDSANGQVAWSHWEQTRTGLAAVFHYQIPQEASHYTADFCCVRPKPQLAGSGQKGETNGTPSSGKFHAVPGYHGYLYLDAETGAVLRFTLEAEMHSNDPMTRMSVWVEYGTVQIGEKDYLCPVRSTALTMLYPRRKGEPGLIRLNEVTFTNYHRFGSTARILPAPPEP